ncbi:zinc ribbon domain-containing protein [Mycobacterium sp. PS03-16]|uniref:zinc ribbon domain-containing protein n=1 Tax=Mycobacterium sp. PS03-16 TaxID=2559611 RepID=UPI001072F06D|nr:zinc ribbon domain-containing protein [Mycobacterium sp. PS03-16]TFV60975.1 zinc ribbon domain-containing protein [Mycobacterium sp. PS03-16]
MPSYSFRCARGCPVFSERHPITAPPDTAVCAQCGEPARRMIGSPALGAGRSAAMRAQDATRATADTPAVVDRVPPRTRGATPVSTNPLHRKLPRP